jgi:hypothetical protein
MSTDTRQFAEAAVLAPLYSNVCSSRLGHTMTFTADPATSTDLLSQVRLEYAARESADARILQLAVAWAEAHPDLEHPVDDDPDSEWCGLPAMRWTPPPRSRRPST